MEGLGIIILFWILSAVFERIRGKPRPGMEGEALPPARRGRQSGRPPAVDPPSRWEEVPARRVPVREGGLSGRPAAPADSAEDQWRKELEQLFGIPGERGPLGRHSPVELPPAEEVEEPAPPEVEHEVVSFDEGISERTAPRRGDQDEGAEALVQRRIDVAEARSHGLTRTDHDRFDRTIRTAPPIAVADHTAARRPRGSLRDALIWREILGPPLGLGRPE